MDWLADAPLIWLEWQIRATIFAVVVVWTAFGTGIRSPVWRCAVLIIGCWILILFPNLLLVAPAMEIPVLAPGGVALSILDGLQGHVVTTIFVVAVLATSFLLIRIFRSLTKLVRLHASLSEAKPLQPLFDECKALVGFDNRVRLGRRTKCYTSTLAEVPLTYGVGRHYVVLPDRALDWSKEDLKVCLVHELWHVKRADWLSQQVAGLVSLFNVFNPIVWVIRRELGKKIEASVDKLCIQSGVNSRHYAEVLLRQTRSGKFMAGFMSPTYFGAHRYGSSDIQQRIGSLVDEPFGWASVPVWKLLPLSLLLFVVAVFLCSVQFVPRLEQSVTYSRSVLLSNVSIETPRDYLQPDFSATEAIAANYEMPAPPQVAYSEWIMPTDFPAPGSGKTDNSTTPNTLIPLVRIKPRYPPIALENGIEGYVDIEFDISKSGTTENLKIVEYEPSDIFNRESLKVIARLRYRPKVVNGQPVVVYGVTERVRFEIEK